MKNYYAEFEGQLKEKAILNALIAENLGKVKQNLSDSEEKDSGKKGGQKRLETLKKKGVLKRKGAAKGGSWQIIEK